MRRVILIIVLLLGIHILWAQTPIYQQDFEDFVFDTGTEVTTFGDNDEWTFAATGSHVARLTYNGDWGSGTTTGFRGNDFVMGYQHSGTSGVFTATLTVTNNTGEVISDLYISYMGRVERVGEGRSPEWTVHVDGVEIPDLFYSTSVGEDQTKSAVIGDVNIGIGETFTIEWSSDRGQPSGSSKQIGIADVLIDISEVNQVAIPTFSPPAGIYTEPVDVEISTTTENATIHYTLDGTNPDQTSPIYTEPINIDETTTVKARAYKEDYLPSSIATAEYQMPTFVQDLAALRNSPQGELYTVTGEVILTFQQDFRNNKFVQDDTAAILIDDDPGIITTTYERGDGITNLTGTLGEYGNMLQFNPTIDPGAPTSTGNVIEPAVLTIDQMNTNFMDYQAQLVTIENANFTDTGSFANGQVYDISDDSGNGEFRTTFYDVDYIGDPIPQEPLHLTGLLNSRFDGDYITARDWDDMEILTGAVATPTFDPPAGNYIDEISVIISCATEDATIHYTTDGTEPDQTSPVYMLPIDVDETTTIKARAYLEGLDPSAIATAVYSFPVEVSDIAQLRDSPLDLPYTLTSEAIITFQHDFRNSKFIQDNTAAILIDDNDGLITTAYERGDGISNLSGILTEYDNMLQFSPLADPGPPTSTGNIVTPTVLTIDEMMTNFMDYQAQLVTIEDCWFTDTGTFANGQVYGLSDDSGDGEFRTTFYDLDYIGDPIPTETIHLTGLLTSRATGDFITSRDWDDMEIIPNVVATPEFSPEGGTYFDDILVEITCDTENAEIYYTDDGTEPDQNSTLYTDPILIDESVTLKARAYHEDMVPSSIATAEYVLPITVYSLSELRDAELDKLYKLDTEVTLTFQQDFRNQKYIQDATAAILIDDAPNGFFDPGVITTVYEIGDGISGLIGYLNEHETMLQLIPQTDPGPPTSTGNVIIPEVLTVDEMNTYFMDYQAQLVTIEETWFSNTGTFANGQVYTIADTTGSAEMRTTFYDVDYIGDDIPTQNVNLTGILNSRSAGDFITPRNWDDMEILPDVVATPVLDPQGGYFYEDVLVSISCETEDAQIYYTTDGSEPTTNSNLYTDPILVDETTTIKARAFKEDYIPSEIAEEEYILPIVVTDIAELRDGIEDGPYYELIGEVILTFQQDFRNQKYIQDSTAAILIDDAPNGLFDPGVITTEYELGDGISGIIGSLTNFENMLQFIPALDPGAPTSSGNIIDPEIITLDDMMTNFSDYQAQVVMIESVAFSASGDFANGEVYPIIDDTGTGDFRTSFYDVDYIGDLIPTTLIHLTGILNSTSAGDYITARNWDDIEIIPDVVETPTFSPPAGNYYEDVVVTIECATEDVDIYYTTDGTNPTPDSNLYTDPITISETTTLKARAYKEYMIPSGIATGLYRFPEEVADLAELRDGILDGRYYHFTGEAVISYQRDTRNQKYIQDETAAILIDDDDGIFTTDYELGDSIGDFIGYLDSYNQMVQFIPITDAGAPISSGNTITPIVITLNDISSEDQGKLMKVHNVEFADSGNFSAAANYTITDPTGTLNFRTNFAEADYIGEPIPQEAQDLIVLVGQYNDDLEITARFWDDFIAHDDTAVYSYTHFITADTTEEFPETAVQLDFSGVSAYGNVTVNFYDDYPEMTSGITHDYVSQYHWHIITGDFGFDTALLDFYLDNIENNGILTPETVHIYSRPEYGQGDFSLLATSYADDTLSATIDELGEFVFASDDNPLSIHIPQELPFAELFEFEHIPFAWTQEYIVGTQDWVFQAGGYNSNPPSAHTGDYNAAFLPETTGNTTKLVTPPIDLTPAEYPELKFWHAQVEWNDDQDELHVYYKLALEDNWQLLESYTENVSAWTERTIQIPETSQSVYFAFEAIDGGGYGVCIDDVEVYDAGPPPVPEIAVTPSEFDLSLVHGETTEITLNIANPGTADLDYSITVAYLEDFASSPILTLANSARRNTTLNTVNQERHTDYDTREEWLIISNTTGIVPPGESVDIPITIDATELDPDNYEAELIIANNAEDDVVVPVYLEVEVPPLNPPENLAIDTATGLFSWDEPDYSNLELIEYEIYLDGDLEATTEENEYLFEDLVYDETYIAGVKAIYNWGESDLETIEFTFEGIPQISVTPEGFNVDVEYGGQVSEILLIMNPGTAPLDFDIVIEEDGERQSGLTSFSEANTIRLKHRSHTRNPIYRNWLSADPNIGTIQPEDNQIIDILFDASELLGGTTYTAEIIINNNAGDAVIIPVSLNVGEQPIIPPSNLEADIVNVNDVELNWEQPELLRSVSGYNVYMNDEVIAEIEGAENTNYLVEALDEGLYNFFVTAIYDEVIESDPSNDVDVAIELAPPFDFDAASQVTDVLCTWQAPIGATSITSYRVYRDDELIAEVTNTEYLDTDVPEGTYTYYATAIYNEEYESSASNQVTIDHTDANETAVPAITALMGNYPNPFNPETIISFSLKEDCRVLIEIYDIKGKKVRTLMNEYLSASEHTIVWDGKNEHNQTVGSGVYFYRMSTDSYSEVKKMMLIK